MSFLPTATARTFSACLREHPAGYMQLLDLAERARRAVTWFARLHLAGDASMTSLARADTNPYVAGESV